MTNAELAILSLIVEEARHGYELEALIEARGVREWTEVGFSSIYYVLKKLEKRGVIVSHLEAAPQGPSRKVYTATDKGRSELREAVLTALSQPQHDYPTIQLGLANLPILNTHEAIAALEAHHGALLEEIERLNGVWSAQHDRPYFVQAMFDYSVTMLQARRTWLETFIHQLKEQ